MTYLLLRAPQTQARTPSEALNLREGLKQLSLMRMGDADTSISDLKTQFFGSHLRKAESCVDKQQAEAKMSI